jgi:hypothetical protein
MQYQNHLDIQRKEEMRGGERISVFAGSCQPDITKPSHI